MHRSTSAALGAWNLGPTGPSQAWGDACASIALVGDQAGSIEPTTELPRLTDPIAAARAWLGEPENRSQIPPVIIEQAEASLDVAGAHLRELDLLAGELAREASDGGVVDAIRLEQLDLMARTMREFAERMRTLLDPGTLEAHDAERRLRTGIAAAAHGGGLPALVAAL